MRRGFAWVIGLFLLAVPALALDAPRSDADVILTVDGEIAVTNAPGTATFDRTLLREIGWQEIQTFSPFLEGEQRFGGVPIAAFLSILGVEEGALHATALDDYSVTLPVTELLSVDALLAMEHEGREMRIRNRGPIWLIFPMTQEEAARGTGEGKMIWQLSHITVQP